MDDLLQDIRFGFRMLARNPGFTFTAATILALGIGATTSMFSVVDTVLLAPLPYSEPERLVIVWERTPQGQRNVVSAANFVDWSDQNEVFTSMCAMVGQQFVLTGTEQPEQIPGARVSTDFFELLGVEPFAGRTFLPQEGEPGADKVVILSHDLWQLRFGSDRSLIGTKTTIDGEPFTVVGVMPPDFRFRSERDQMWAPLALARDQMTRDLHYLRVLARLRPGVTLAEAGADMERIAANIAKAYPSIKEGWSVTIDPLRQWLVGSQLRESLILLFAAVGFLLMIACVNIANLLLARSTTRQREMAIRRSLGACRWRLVRQVLTESVLLASLGGAMGVVVASWFVSVFSSIFPAVTLPATANLEVDGRVLAFSLAVAIATAVLFGLVPALAASRARENESLNETGRTIYGGAAGRRFRYALVVAQVAVALVLAVGAGLMMRSLLRFHQVDPGIRVQGILTMSIDLPETKYNDAPRIIYFFRQALQRIEALPGVRSAAITTTLPLQGSMIGLPFQIDGSPLTADSSRLPDANFQMVSPDYFATMGIEMLRGRPFEEADNEDSTRVAVVNETFVSRFLPDEEPIGKTFNMPLLVPGKRELAAPVPWTIIGVIRNVKVFGLRDETAVEVYVPYFQSAWKTAALAVRTEVEPMSLARAVRAAVLSVDRDQPVTRISSMEEIMDSSTSQTELRSALLGLFASLALLLAAFGIYGVLSYSVSERRHELGLRVALGAQPGDVFRTILGHALSTAFIGVIIGAAAAVALTRLISNLLFGVLPSDPLTFAVAALILIGVASLAGTVPARRASRVDPIIALRHQ